MQNSYLKNNLNLKFRIVLDSVIRYTLGKTLKINYKLYKSLDNNIV